MFHKWTLKVETRGAQKRSKTDTNTIFFNSQIEF